MSARRRRSGGRNRRMWLPRGLPFRPTEADLDDMPLSAWAQLGAKKSAPKKTPQKRRKNESPRVAPETPVETITLDESIENIGIVENVNSKIETFMETASFLSSDEEEIEMIKAKTNKKPVPNQFFISDDSDDEIKIVNVDKVANTNNSTAGTSTSTFNAPKAKVSEDDVMNLIDAVLENSNSGSTALANDVKSLEDLTKETEEMLKNATSLLDEFKTSRKPEPEVKKVESPKVKIGSCPICLESLSDRPAAVTICGHVFCKECITETARTMKKCPTCRKTITAKKIHPIYL
ncbi:E3 ubiquitin-protein ligase BRE1-like [Tribolium madens]|uniref:E3 ubiquitin-protein ligase BRE1-like n=1 Tax=Tribolium madens TaxID=41895 RepID=UPI001CF73D82|nr:E3 ubiquitin-protein ligase BRE1-like [Tribolium madens]